MSKREVGIAGFIITTCTLILGGAFFGIRDLAELNQEEREVREIQQTPERQSGTDQVVRRIYYIKDQRTNLCFAYLFSQGATIATVPCEAVPDSMLSVGG